MVAVTAFEFLEPDAVAGAEGQVNTGGTRETPTTPEPDGGERQESDKGKEQEPPASVENLTKVKKFHDKYLLKTFLALLAVALVSGAYYDRFVLQPTCDPEEQIKGLRKLATGFEHHLFGQHIAVDGVLRALYAHLTDPEPKKALVLCFHGWLGSGKTHTAQLIAKHLYHDMDKSSSSCSPFAKTFVGPRHFLLDASKLKENQAKLIGIVEETVRGYGRSLFVFDEVDKMPPEIFDVLLPFMDHHTSIDGVDYRKAIFIFLSNTGGAKINEKLLQAMGTESKKREEVTLYDFRDVIADGAFTEQGGLFKGEMISRKLVDHYVPFLPLERIHVVQCARREIQRRKILYIPPERIADRVSYQRHTSKNSQDIFWLATDGCKNIATHTAYFFHDSATAFTSPKPEL